MPPMPPLRGLLIVRHAQSTWNAEGRWQGHADPPLSDLGERQAQQAAARVAKADANAEADAGAFDLIASSDLERARRTAELMAAVLGYDAPVTIDPGLREFDVGAWSGLTRGEIEARWPGVLARFDLTRDAPPSGERPAKFDARVGAAAARIAKLATASGAKRVLVVSHGGVLRAVARMAGVATYRIGHLAGYEGTYDEGHLLPKDPVDLIESGDIQEFIQSTARLRS